MFLSVPIVSCSQTETEEVEITTADGIDMSQVKLETQAVENEWAKW
jgi:hypothetical protein